MRVARKNTIPLWYSYPLPDEEKVEVLDANGNFTGDYESDYSNPKLIRISLVPISGYVRNDSQGITWNVDFITSTNYDLSKQGVLYKKQPLSGDEDYDYVISEKEPWLNAFRYGVKLRNA